MSGDYTWDQMPEELALQLFDLVENTESGREANTHSANDLVEWLQNEMKTCSATPRTYLGLVGDRCSNLPIPGSGLCNEHLPKEDVDG